MLDTAAEKSSPHVARAKKAIAMAARDAARLAQSSNNRAMVVARGLYKEELVPRANIARTRAEAEWEVFVAHAKHAYDVHVEPALTGGEAPIYVNVILPAFEKNIRPLYPDYVEPFLNDVRSKAQPFVDEHAVPLYASVREYVVPLFDLKLVPFYRENLRDGVRIVWMKVEQSMDEASKVVAGIPYSAKKYLEVWVDAVDRVLRSAKVQAPKIASIAWAKVGPQYVMGIHNFEDFVGSSAERAVKWSLAWIIAWAVWNLGPLIVALSAVVHAVWTCLFFVFLISARASTDYFEALSPFRLLTWPFENKKRKRCDKYTFGFFVLLGSSGVLLVLGCRLLHMWTTEKNLKNTILVREAEIHEISRYVGHNGAKPRLRQRLRNQIPPKVVSRFGCYLSFLF